ncbi:MAG: hypothetical protein AUG44_08785 [Actinobacteria bacterium 13_1_20CM_3_71_11]|nr:MAG: hypothetical protein AUG44_08785 [Actinobacteria bacterium 13_1_20CM_3_71_11]
MESRIPATVDAIVTALQTAGLNVLDGPVLTGDPSDVVLIGFDGDNEGEQQAATNTQTWAGIGAKKRDEEFEIIGAICVLVGGSDPSWKSTRDRTFSYLETMGQTLRANPSLGQSPPFVAELIPGDYFQENTTVGYQARIVFRIHVKTRV